jgi:hypothetical protein
VSTRGSLTFVVDNDEKTSYNHHDSYPSGLGAKVLCWLRDARMDKAALHRSARQLRVASFDSSPTPEDIERLAEFADRPVSERTVNSWYSLLGNTQGSPGEILRAGVIEDCSGFPFNSVSCEWGYVVDLDTGTFEVYEGHQDEPHGKGRFAARADAITEPGCYPIALVASWPLSALPSQEDFLATFS